MRKWLRIIALLCALTLLPVCAGAMDKNFTVRHGSREEKRIAITMDDCYDVSNVRRALDVCYENDVRITFFVVGSAIKDKDAALWQEIVREGFEIGNHTWSHPDLTTLSARNAKYQLLRVQQQLDKMLGFPYAMQVMRPPYGRTTPRGAGAASMLLLDSIEQCGYRHVVKWDVSQIDPKKAVNAVQNGSILLYHANIQDIHCLAALIPALKERGFEFCTVSELLNLDEIATSTDLYVYQP